MARMSTSYIGSDALTNPVTPLTIPGFDVLDPTSYAPSSGTSAAATLASTSPTQASTTSSPSSSTSSSSSSDGLNTYQQALANLSQWQAQILQESLFGDTSDATNALYASAGLSADQFANLATELQNIQASGSTGSIVNTTA
jgi:hypothetical protein